jgi:hypothetical protein
LTGKCGATVSGQFPVKHLVGQAFSAAAAGLHALPLLGHASLGLEALLPRAAAHFLFLGELLERAR